METKNTNLITTEKPVLVLRVCNADMTSYGGFIWPDKGPVECPDWKDNTECGNGLHGWLWGEGDHSVANIQEDSKWLVVQVGAYVPLGGKVKYPKGEVVYCGDSLTATTYLSENGGFGRAIIKGTATAGDEGTATAGDYGTATAGYKGTATAGDEGTATAGDYGTATAGYKGTATAGDEGTATAGYKGTATAGYKGTATAGDKGTATAGDYGTATAGDKGTATAGDEGTATAGYKGTATAGYKGTATAGDKGTATAGDYGTATAGDKGTATAGDEGTATAGYKGTATAGDEGTLIIKRWNGTRWKFSIAYVGEDGIKPNKAYKLDREGKFIEAQC